MTVDQQTVETFLADLAAEIAKQTAQELAKTFPDPERLLTVEEAANFANVTGKHIRNLMAKGDLAFVKVGETTRLFRADLEAYLDSRRVASSREGGGGSPA